VDRIPAIRRVILADVSLAKGALWSVAAVAAPTALGVAIGQGVLGVPFITYFPAVLLAALLLSWRWGSAVLVASGIAANWAFLGEPFAFSFTVINLARLAIFIAVGSALVWVGEMARRLVRELQATQARETLLNHELMHRVKNMLATVNAMAVLTARHCEPGQFVPAFSGRMQALNRATELLAVGKDLHCEVRKLVESAIEPFRTDGNFMVEGPSCQLPRDACVPLSLALHELCTNAAKHGALSASEGRVELRWRIDTDGKERALTLDWCERGGPPVPEIRKAGMGTQLLRRQRGLKSVDVQFAREGLTCEICIDGVETEDSAVSRAAA
jgi:two-component sensor histidine kinase